MIRPGLAVSGTLALVLAAVIAAELDDSPATRIAPAITAAASPEPTLASPPDHAERWIATSLQRPLFAPDRRPAASASDPAGPASTGLPRLAGTLVSAAGRVAIFAGEAGSHPVVVSEGGTLGAWVVHAIVAGQVTLSGPGGARTLRPAFDTAAAAAAAPRTAVPTAAGVAGFGQPALLLTRGTPVAPPNR